jgi:hypothetical protein
MCETGTDQQVAQLLDCYMMMMIMMIYFICSLTTLFSGTLYSVEWNGDK